MQSFITLRENKPKWFHTRINVSHTLSVTHTHSESTHYQSHTQTQDGRGTVSTRELRKICRVERRRVTRKEFRHQDHRSSRSPLVWLRCSRKVWLLNTTKKHQFTIRWSEYYECNVQRSTCKTCVGSGVYGEHNVCNLPGISFIIVVESWVKGKNIKMMGRTTYWKGLPVYFNDSLHKQGCRCYEWQKAIVSKETQTNI